MAKRAAGADGLSRRAAMTGMTSAVLGAVSAACLPDWGAGRPAAGSPTEKATISYALWDTPGSAERTRARADDFEARYPGGKIELLSWPYQQYLDNLQIMYASDSGPDTVHLDMPIVQQYARLGVFQDLMPRLKADRGLKIADFHPLALEIMSGRKDNNLIGLPGGAGPSYIYYNRALLDAAGRPTPHALYRQDRWTWDAWMDMARATTKITPEGEWQVAGCNPHLVRCWLAANGAAEFDNYRGPTRCLYDTPAAIEALTFVSELYTRWKVTPVNVTAASSPLGANDINAFGLGKLTLNGRWGPPISQYRNQVTFKWGLVPYPKGRGPQAKMTNDFATSGTAIARRTKAPNLAWAWAKFTVDEEGQLLSVKHSGGTGMPFSKVAQEATIQELSTIPTLETPEMTVEMTRKGNGVVRLASVNQVEINAMLNEELARLWRGESSPPVAAREAASRVNRFLQDNPQ